MYTNKPYLYLIEVYLTTDEEAATKNERMITKTEIQSN